MANKVLTYNLSEPLDGATTAKININTGTGNVSVATLTNGEPMLASGALEYLERQGEPTRSLSTSNGQATFTVKASGLGKVGFRFPWQACNGETNWQIYLGPRLQSDITVHSDGGSIQLNLDGLAVTRLTTDTGGGNIDLVLPDINADLNMTAKSGAGNVTVLIPSGIAARIHAATGMGKVIVSSRFSKVDGKTYQSPDYDSASHKAEITLSSGAGNVVVNTK